MEDELNELRRLVQEGEERRAELEQVAAERERAIEIERAAREDERKRREAAEQEAAVRKRQIEAAEKAIEDERKLRQAAERVREQLDAGTYFSSIEAAFTPVPVDYTREHFDSLFREAPPKGYKYDVTYREANNVTNYVSGSARTSETDPNVRDQAWLTDIFGEDDFLAEVAHLIPAATTNASLYDDVASCVLGLTKGLDPEDLDVKQRAIHGAKRSAQSQKINYSGLKHSRSNKIRLKGQLEYMDKNPCVVIVPIMNLEELKGWNGESYDAIVLADSWTTDIRTIAIRHVCQGIRLVKEPAGENELATSGEIEKARKLLEQVLCGLGYSLLERDRPFPREEANKLFNDLKNQYTNVQGKVTVPSMAGNDNMLRVRKVTFGLEGKHPSPDPFLLAVKAAVVWSTRYGEQLLACGEVPDDDIDSLSMEEEEEYVASLKQSYRPQTLEDLAVGLGQPHGYISDAVIDADSRNGDDSQDGNDRQSREC